jgi:radical SAM-linked protein
VAQAVHNIASTGYDEVSLVSLSTSDYEELEALMAALRTALAKDMVNLSFPSLRPEKFTPQVAYYAKDVRKSGLTLAPEAGCQRLRDLINKTTTEEDLIAAVQLAFREGWKLIKLYFMIGHPTETEADLNEMIALIHKVAAIARIHKGAGLHVSISPFVPKAVTPFQWCRQDRSEEIRHKIGYIKERVRDKRIKLSWREADLAQVEGVLARGDRRVSRVMYRVWQAGARLEGWSEHFSSERWRQAMAAEGLSYEWFTDELALDAPLPWDHIDKGVTKKFLRDEYQKAIGHSVTPDCRDGDCQRCGLMGKQVCQAIVQPLKAKQNVLRNGVADSDLPTPELPDESKIRMARLKYRRDDAIRFLSHLDVIHLFERTLRRARVAMVYSSGFNPHPRMAFGPPLTTGYRSEAEYLDLHYYAGDDENLAERLAAALPDGLTLLDVKPLFSKHRNLTDVINRADYIVEMPASVEPDKLAALLQQTAIPVLRSKEGEPGKTVDIRPYMAEAEVQDRRLRLVTRIEQGKTVRVNEILTLLLDGHDELVKRCLVTRTGLYIQFGDLIVTPMDV